MTIAYNGTDNAAEKARIDANNTTNQDNLKKRNN